MSIDRRRDRRSPWRLPSSAALVHLLLGAPAAVEGTRGQTDQAPYGGWFDRHERVLRTVAILALAWGTAYLSWRLLTSWAGANPVLFAGLLACELFGIWSLAVQTWFSWSRPRSHRPTATPGRSVDLYVCTYDEPLDVLRATLVGAQEVRYPHRTYVLDDGRRPEVAELARRHGAEYLTRPDNSHAKAGNINAALSRTDGDLVLVLDADHVPMPDVLDAVVGYFDDPDVAVVQTPHDFYNQDSLQHYGLGRHEQSVFFRVVSPGKDRHGGAYWCGSAAVIRRAALLDVGGVATETIAEDFHTTIRMQTRGWTTRYHDEILVQGLAPHDLSSYLVQRDRWARGNLAVLTTPENPLRAPRLSWRQRISHLATLSAYLAGPVRLLTLAVLSAVLWTGALPMTLEAAALLGLWLPWTVLSLTAGSALSRGYMRIGEAVHFEQMTGAIYTRALRCVVRPGRATFNVTPKEGIDLGGMTALRQLLALDVLALLLVLGLTVRLTGSAIGEPLLPGLPGLAFWLVPPLVVLELRRVLRTLYLVSLRRQRRTEFRFATEVPVTVPPHGSHPEASGVTLDLSPRGVRLRLDRPIDVGDPRQVTLLVPQGDTAARQVSIELLVLDCRPDGDAWIVRAVRVDDTSAAHDLLVAWCYVWSSFARLRGRAPAARPAEEPVGEPVDQQVAAAG